jgi:farnesyl diphosphate synthase
MNESEFDLWMRAELDTVERALEHWVPPGAPAGLGEAMRYGVLDGGQTSASAAGAGRL